MNVRSLLPSEWNIGRVNRGPQMSTYRHWQWSTSTHLESVILVYEVKKEWVKVGVLLTYSQRVSTNRRLGVCCLGRLSSICLRLCIPLVTGIGRGVLLRSILKLLVNHRLLLRSLGELESEEKKKCLSLGIEQGPTARHSFSSWTRKS